MRFEDEFSTYYVKIHKHCSIGIKGISRIKCTMTFSRILLNVGAKYVPKYSLLKNYFFSFLPETGSNAVLQISPPPLHICKPHKKSIITKGEKQGDVSTRWDLPKINGKHKFKCKNYSKKEKCITQVMKPP